MNPKRIRVLIVDDSALVRKIVTSRLARYQDFEVVGTAQDAYIARDLILELNPDVVTLDIEMPRMDGITFLKLLMKHRPMPVILMSSLTPTGSAKALEALQAGAVEVVSKPSGAFSAHEDGLHLAEKIRAAAAAHVCPVRVNATPAARPFKKTIAESGPRLADRRIILLGASTGGTEALKTVLMDMDRDVSGICIVQHIPANFSKAFADRLNQLCAMEVREAKQGDVVQRGLALVAPGGIPSDTQVEQRSLHR